MGITLSSFNPNLLSTNKISANIYLNEEGISLSNYKRSEEFEKS